jgi:hypothetical protein
MLDEQNIRNRRLRESRVVHLAGIIDRGEWRLTGDAIVFDENGVLLNGQHRLAACGAVGRSITVIVLRNLPQANQDVMDDTLVRRLADALRLRGITDEHALAAGVGWLHRIYYADTQGLIHYRNDAARPSIPQLLKFYDEHDQLQEAMVQMRSLWKPLKLRPGPAIAVRYRLNEIDSAEAALFFDSLKTLVNLPEGSPVLALRRYIDNERDRYRKSAQPDFKWVAVTFKAWNAWRDGRSLAVLQFSYTPLHKDTWPTPY